MTEPLQYIQCSFSEKESELRLIRSKVFIEEQSVPVELEWDDEDRIAVHFLAYADNQPIATARILPDGKIGRMAVLAPYRGRGVGRLLLQYILHYARQNGMNAVYLSAQQHAVKFYEKQGFEVCSDMYMDANIPHFTMQLNLTHGTGNERNE